MQCVDSHMPYQGAYISLDVPTQVLKFVLVSIFESFLIGSYVPFKLLKLALTIGNLVIVSRSHFCSCTDMATRAGVLFRKNRNRVIAVAVAEAGQDMEFSMEALKLRLTSVMPKVAGSLVQKSIQYQRATCHRLD